MVNNVMPIIGVITLCILIIAAVFEVISARRHERSKQVQEAQETPEATEAAPQHVDINVTVLHVPAPSQDDRECVHQYDECWAVQQAETIAFLQWYSDPLQG